MTSKIERACDNCKEMYFAEQRYLNRGQGIYCSRACSVASVRAKQIARNQNISIPNVTCAYCSREFYKNKSKSANSKTGLFFCCREHKDLAQRIGGIEAIQPSHYGNGNGKYDYRIRAINFYGSACQNCHDARFPAIVEVNHRDCNRNNNDLSNLEVLCGTCHNLFHWLTSTGNYSSLDFPYELSYANSLFYRDLAEYFA